MKNTVHILTKAYSTVESIEEIEAYLLELSLQDFLELKKIKKDMDVFFKKHSVKAQSIKLNWNKGEFVPVEDSDLSFKISKTPLVGKNLNIVPNEVTCPLEQHCLVLTSSGFQFEAWEKHNQIMWFTKSLTWDYLSTIEEHLKV